MAQSFQEKYLPRTECNKVILLQLNNIMCFIVLHIMKNNRKYCFGTYFLTSK